MERTVAIWRAVYNLERTLSTRKVVERTVAIKRAVLERTVLERTVLERTVLERTVAESTVSTRRPVVESTILIAWDTAVM